MNSLRQSRPPGLLAGALLALTCALASPPGARSQSQAPTPPEQASAQAVPAEPARAETDAAHKRLSRARSLAAIGKLAAAAGELEALRNSTKDDSVRDVARVLLVAIFVEMPDYQRAIALLEEAYGARAAGRADDAANHSYFAIAGQTVNAVRTHLDRYRAFGVNVADTSELTADAVGDLEQLRGLLDRLVEQAKALRAEQSKGGGGSRGLDAAALLEDAATVRMRIARHDQDRARWQSEISEARQHLFSSDMRIASISQLPATPVAAVAAPAAAAAQPARPEQKGSDAAQKNARRSRPAPGEQTAMSPTANGQGAAQPAASAAPAEQRPAAAAPQGRADNSPVSVGSLVGKAKQRIAPSYPQLARTARVSGNVTVYLVVNEKGEVESVQRADGPQQLQQAAIDAARRWKFNPTVIDGQTVRVSGFLHFNFTL